MADIVVLAAGASSRFVNSKPKWLLTHPNGKYLFQRCFEGLRGFKSEAEITIMVLREHLEAYDIPSKDLWLYSGGCNILVLDKMTSCQAETAKRAVEMISPKGAIFFKDCDSFFHHTVEDTNQVVVSHVDNHAPLDFGSKCFVQTDNVGRITNIVEKKIISPDFAVGGYGFESAGLFNAAYAACPARGSETFLSHVVLSAMLQGAVFTAAVGHGYEDYGTPRAWREEVGRYGTIFVDLDGTLLKTTGGLGPLAWGHGQPIPENIGEIRRLYATGRWRIVITTARPDSAHQLTMDELRSHQIPFHQLVTGCLHAPRLIINDRGPNAPPMVAHAEIERDAPKLAFWTAHLK